MIDKRQLNTLCDIALRAGDEVMAVYGTDFESWSKDDDSPLTQADLRADAVIRQGLEAAFPGVFILSEESSSKSTAPQHRFFLVDPLDGTKEFLKRNDEFTVNIALVDNGVPIAGVVYAPVLKLVADDNAPDVAAVLRNLAAQGPARMSWSLPACLPAYIAASAALSSVLASRASEGASA